MKKSLSVFLGLWLLGALVSCSSRQNRVYPDNGVLTYFDASAGTVGGNLDATGVQLHYKGALKDSIEDIQLIEASASHSKGGRKAALRELQEKAQKLGADGIYDIQFDSGSSEVSVSGIAFRFKR